MHDISKGLQCQAHLASKCGLHSLEGLKQVLDVLSLHHHQRAVLLQGLAQCLHINAPHQQALSTSSHRRCQRSSLTAKYLGWDSHSCWELVLVQISRAHREGVHIRSFLIILGWGQLKSFPSMHPAIANERSCHAWKSSCDTVACGK